MKRSDFNYYKYSPVITEDIILDISPHINKAHMEETMRATLDYMKFSCYENRLLAEKLFKIGYIASHVEIIEEEG